MFAKSMNGPALAGGLLLVAALIGCGGEQSIASQSAEAFREAQKKGETPGGDGHGHGGHGHGTPAHDSAHSAPEAGEAGHLGEHPAGHEHGQDHGAAEAPAGGSTPKDQEETGHAGHAGHAGHGTTSPQAPSHGTQAQGHEHAGHSPSAAAAPPSASAPAPVAVPPEQPAKTLQPDALDAPAATSVVDAQRSAEMSREMAGGHGGHGGHGVGRYRHVDAGRGPAYLESDRPPGAGSGSQQHDHGSAGGGHSGPGEHEAAGLYVCPMHPEVTGETPGMCPKCGMALVERRKG